MGCQREDNSAPATIHSCVRPGSCVPHQEERKTIMMKGVEVQMVTLKWKTT